MSSEYPSHLQNLVDNLKEVTQLTTIHREIAGGKPGRKFKVQILNKSAVVLLCACFEYYVEDLLECSFHFLLDKATSHEQFSDKVLVKATKDIRKDNDPRKIWEIAGTGWKTILEDYKNKILRKEIDYFHVPRPDNIDDLYEKILGLKNISDNFYWRKMSNHKAKNTLNDFIDLRGAIAHKVQTANTVWKKDVENYGNFLLRVSVIMNNRVREYLMNSLDEEPWAEYKYRSVK